MAEETTTTTTTSSEEEYDYEEEEEDMGEEEEEMEDEEEEMMGDEEKAKGEEMEDEEMMEEEEEDNEEEDNEEDDEEEDDDKGIDDDYDNMRIEQAAVRHNKNKCERKGGYCKLPVRGWCKDGYRPTNTHTCDSPKEICCQKRNSKPKCGVSSLCKKHGGWCMSNKEHCRGKTIHGKEICGSKKCKCCVEEPEKPPPPCNAERGLCRKCGKAPIEVAHHPDDGTRVVPVHKYDLEGNASDEGTRIINGEKASPQEYPYQAALIRAPEFQYICSGSIITQEWVLTAAHCVERFRGNYTRLRVGVGSIFLDKLEYIPVERVIIHEDYNDLHFVDGDDVALIKLSLLLEFQNNPSVQPVCLAEAEDLIIGQDLVNSGWGLTRPPPDGDISKVLNEVRLTQVDVELCALFSPVPKDRKKVICTLTENKDSCRGDSGGPLVKQLCDGRWVQAGIVSYGAEFCNGTGFYTSVPYYKDWIISNIEKPISLC